MAHLHGERAYGTGGGTSNQNLIGALDRDSADSSSSTEVAAAGGGTSRVSAGSDLESFDESKELEARLRESGNASQLAAAESENAPPVSAGPISAPLQFDGIVSLEHTDPAAGCLVDAPVAVPATGICRCCTGGKQRLAGCRSNQARTAEGVEDVERQPC